MFPDHMGSCLAMCFKTVNLLLQAQACFLPAWDVEVHTVYVATYVSAECCVLTSASLGKHCPALKACW